MLQQSMRAPSNPGIGYDRSEAKSCQEGVAPRACGVIAWLGRGFLQVVIGLKISCRRLCRHATPKNQVQANTLPRSFLLQLDLCSKLSSQFFPVEGDLL